MFDFIASEYGKEAIRRYLIAVNNPEVRVDSARVAFGIEAGDFDRAFQMYARTRFGAR